MNVVVKVVNKVLMNIMNLISDFIFKEEEFNAPIPGDNLRQVTRALQSLYYLTQ